MQLPRSFSKCSWAYLGGVGAEAANFFCSSLDLGEKVDICERDDLFLLLI